MLPSAQGESEEGQRSGLVLFQTGVSRIAGGEAARWPHDGHTILLDEDWSLHMLESTLSSENILLDNAC